MVLSTVIANVLLSEGLMEMKSSKLYHIAVSVSLSGPICLGMIHIAASSVAN